MVLFFNKFDFYYIMTRNKHKIIRSVTVSQSLGFCREVMIKMRAMGYDMVAVTSPGPELDELRDKDGFHCVEVPMQRHISVVNDLKSLIRMIRVFRKEKPQVVHSMTPKAGMICMVAAWLTRVPVRIHTFTGLVWPTATGLKRRLLMMTDRITCACATHVIPEGKGVMHDLQHGGITSKPMRVLGHGNVKGVDIERFDPSRLGAQAASGAFTFLFVGRIVGEKGINELVEAFARLHEEQPATRLVLVGNYETELDPLSQGTRRIIDAMDAIETPGPKRGDDLVSAYAEADCFVMPSYREGFPNVVLEAGAMGLPSVVTDINGSREIVENGKNGLVVPPRDAAALYDAMKLMATDNEARQRMAREARPMIVSRFERGYVQRCQIEFYKDVINLIG